LSKKSAASDEASQLEDKLSHITGHRPEQPIAKPK
jgi:hypothetical protein